MRAGALLFAVILSSSALAEPVRLVAVPRIRDVETGACNDDLDRRWREALKDAAETYVQLLEEPLDKCEPDTDFGVEAPYAIVAHAGKNGIVLSVVDRAADKRLATLTALMKNLEKVAGSALSAIPAPPPPEPKKRNLAEEPEAIRLDLPEKTRAELEARVAELQAAKPTTGRNVAIVGFIAAGAFAAAAEFGLPFLKSDSVPGPLGTSDIRVKDKLVDPSLMLGLTSLAALFTGCGGLIASNGEDAAREEELEILLARLGRPDPLGAAIEVIEP